LPSVDVVVPVHGAAPLVRRCLASVRRELAAGDRLVVVDDASPDPALVAELRALAAQDPRVVLLENPKNLGFLGTANRGMAHAAGRDVLLLNSDTELFDGALLGLGSAAHAHPRNGLASPLSNNATLCSVPVPGVSNPPPAGVTPRKIAALVRDGSPLRRPELVTPHGFCLYVRADCLAAVGLFDAERFGRGFGEENDLGERAKALGFRAVLADDVYVWHEGKASFGDEGRALERAHATVLEARHPGYHARVARYLEENPLRLEQERLARHLARRSHQTEPAPLFVLHADPFAATPGGVEHCVRDLVAGLASPRALLLYPSGAALEVAEVLGGAVHRATRYRFPLARAPERFCVVHDEAVERLAEVLDLFHVNAVHLHHLMFLPLRLLPPIRSRGLPYSVTVHDYYPVCRSHNLLGPGLRAPCPAAPGCRGPAAAECQRALHQELGEPLPRDPLAALEEHRHLSAELLRGAEALVFPSRAALAIVGGAVDLRGRRCHVVPHALPGVGTTTASRGARRPGPLRIALLGQIAYASKGAEDYLALAWALRGAEVELHVFGPTAPFGFDARLAEAAGQTPIVRHGEYLRSDAVSRLVAADVDVGVLLPIWPETFSYTLSELLAAGVPVVARRIGALAERLEGAPGARLVDDADAAARELRALSERPEEARAVSAPWSAALGGRAAVDAWVAWHAGLVAALHARSPRRAHGTLDTRGHAR
ncbi:MAG: glycosyltransferase, partial [Deltaproteobacteria bacterium]|nr:glycosyltransferase [Deltaproteobacteria bacterium]